MQVTLIHLSDLHFKNDSENRFRLERLREDIESIPLGKNIITVFSGDLAESGKSEQYDLLFDLLLGPLIEADHQIVVVPGNHDIQRDLVDPSLSLLLSNDHASSYLFSGQSIVRTPYQNDSNGPLSNYMELEELFSPYVERNFFGYIKQINDLSIVGMNSSWLSYQREGDVTDRGKLRVEPHVLERYSKKLPENNLKVLLLHHPFDWLEENTRSDIMELAMKNFDLVLYGHVHTADATSLVRSENGASLIQSPPLRADWSRGTNGYSIIRCDTETKATEITYRSYSTSRRKFVLGEDFEKGGVRYPTEKDRRQFQQSPSVPALAQKFLEAGPHDYVDWHRKNVRAKSIYIESNYTDNFIIPDIARVILDEDEPVLESPTSLTQLFDNSSRDQFVIGPADSGLSTSAFLTLKGIAEQVQDTGTIPTFFDAGNSSINRATILRSMGNTSLVKYTSSEMKKLVEEGSVRLIVDDLNLRDAERFNNFRDVMKQYFPKVRVIAFVRTEKVGQAISGSDHPSLDIVEDEVFEFVELGVEEIRNFINMHPKNLNDVTASKLSNHAVESLSQINEPIFPSTVAVLVETLLQDQEFRPINKARLLDRYVECLLGRFELEDVREGAFTSHDKIEFLSYIAAKILERDEFGITKEEWKQDRSEYEKRYLIELPKGLLSEFEDKGLLVSEGGHITFRADYLFSYFIARHMKSNQGFAQHMIEGDRLCRHHREVIYYGELEGTNTAAVLDQLHDQVTSLKEQMIKQYSEEGIDLTTEWQKSANETGEEMDEPFNGLEEVSNSNSNPNPKLADFQDNEKLASVPRSRGIIRRQDVAETEARLLVTIELYGHLIRNAHHISGDDKLRHTSKLFEAAEIWVGFMSASRADIASSPIAIAGGICFINKGALIDRAKSVADFKYNAPNSVSKILAEALKNPQLSIVLRSVLPKLSPMGALFAREALLGLPSNKNRESYIQSITSSDNQTLLTASIYALKRQYLGSGRNVELKDHTFEVVNGIRKLVRKNISVDPVRLKKQQMINTLKTKAREQKPQLKKSPGSK